MDNNFRSLFHELIEQIEIGIIILDDELRVMNWNRFISKRSVKSLEQAQGKPFIEVFPEANGEHFVKVVQLARDRAKHVYSHWLDNLPLIADSINHQGNGPFITALDHDNDFALALRQAGSETKGGADSVGRQTTRSVVHSIFMVIVADALFSVAFSALDL